MYHWDTPRCLCTMLHTQRCYRGVILPVGNIVSDMLSDRDDLYVRSGPGPASGKIAHLSSPPNAHASSESSTGLLRCKNYGCNQSFSEENNSEEACRFHKAPPVFHDTKKGWSCCAKRVYDWDEFHTVSVEVFVLGPRTLF